MNMAESRNELMMCGWRQCEMYRNGWITYFRRFKAGTFCDPEYEYCTLFTNGRVAAGIIQPKRRR
jgi:hypothetical protein